MSLVQQADRIAVQCLAHGFQFGESGENQRLRLVKFPLTSQRLSQAANDPSARTSVHFGARRFV